MRVPSPLAVPTDRQQDGSIRTDTYCFGHPSGKRFRSPNEFITHVFHLASHIPENAGPAATEHSTCSCWICSGSKHGTGVGGGSTGGTPRRAAHQPTAREDANAARREIAAVERLGEQETVGWVFRKGEVVWIWLPGDDVPEDEAEPDGDDENGDGQWAAGIVTVRPTINPPHRKPQKPTGAAFADIDMDDTPPWQQGASDDDKTYRVQLLAPPADSAEPETVSSPGEVRAQVPQHFLRPWLARTQHARIEDDEHESVAPAREVAGAFSLFERTRSPASSDAEQINSWGGVFLGAEKIFLGEPVRILNPSHTPGGTPSSGTDTEEDVLVISSIYTTTTPSIAQPGKKKSVTLFNGSVYTTSPTGADLEPEVFAALPFRMRRGDGSGETLRWRIRNNAATERGELSLRMILGRWYEPMAVAEWLRHEAHDPSDPKGKSAAIAGAGVGPSTRRRLGRARVQHARYNRAATLGWSELDGVRSLGEDEPARPPPQAVLAEPPPSSTAAAALDAMDLDETPLPREEVRSITPERGFKSVNATPRQPPNSAGRSRMAMAVDGDDDDDEEEEEEEEEEPPQVPALDVQMHDDASSGIHSREVVVLDDDSDDDGPLGKSPTKRSEFSGVL